VAAFRQATAVGWVEALGARLEQRTTVCAPKPITSTSRGAMGFAAKSTVVNRGAASGRRSTHPTSAPSPE
jgi:hypothetical protein